MLHHETFLAHSDGDFGFVCAQDPDGPTVTATYWAPPGAAASETFASRHALYDSARVYLESPVEVVGGVRDIDIAYSLMLERFCKMYERDLRDQIQGGFLEG